MTTDAMSDRSQASRDIQPSVDFYLTNRDVEPSILSGDQALLHADNLGSQRLGPRHLLPTGHKIASRNAGLPQHGVHDGYLDSVNVNVSHPFSYNEGTLSMNRPSERLSISNSKCNVPALDFTGMPYAFDSFPVTINHSETLNHYTTEWDSLKSNEAFFPNAHITGNNILPTYRPAVIYPQTNDWTTLFDATNPESEPYGLIPVFRAFELPNKCGLDELGVKFAYSASTNTLENPLTKPNDGKGKAPEPLNRATRASTPPISSKKRRFDSDSDASSTPGECPFCDGFRGNAKRLREHMRCHIREHVCEAPRCSQRFSTARDLRRHAKSAHQKAKLTCHICSASIQGGRVDNLQRHIRNRHNEEP
ncbi:hypothetical protein BDP55DRAFT_402704 [Colletotrichum godetiae]|uniref:C2H2-type domain-containing protein n=1 Tax=Colletotrichum godetiae TaxID=1209918 RepID=A0AAJ0EP48_9PEZI|nr:uncharacterized protein BDP55DRAFT_402704 [Colletotrichum godetiae]KAK1658217.1 hypothetical protein BDP55DRAFT_402704 [Colletotrichum godetiae]